MRAFVGCTGKEQHGSVLTWNASRDIGCLISGDPFFDDTSEAVAPTFVQRYEERGLESLLLLQGWFHGVLLDLRQRRLVLFNDRFGLGHLYLHQSGGQTLFSSEAKSLLAVLPQSRRLDPQGLSEWLSCGCVLQNRTLFSGISLLPPGSAWIFSPDGVARRRYFDPATWESQSPLSPDAYEQRFAEIFPQALRRSLRGSDPIAMSLTGGLDGRMIMAWDRSRPGALPCYTFNGPHRDCADARIARRIAKICGQSHQDIPVGDEFLAEFSQLAEQSVFISDGAMDVTGAAELYANRLAREFAPVRLTGNYGSEMIRRHVAFKPRRLAAGLFAPEIEEHARAAATTYAEEARGHALSFIAFKQVPWHHFARFAVERSQIKVRSPFLDHDLVALSFQAPPESATSLEPSLRLIAKGDPQLARIPTDRGVTWPPPGRTVNRLRRAFHDYVAKAEYAYDYGMPDWLARMDRSVSRLHLEKLFLGRQKFCHFRSWYRGPLADCVREVLFDARARSRSYLAPSAIENAVGTHLRADGNRTIELHKLLSLELIHRTLLCAPEMNLRISARSVATVASTDTLVH
ncbi:MAG TPA: asparagine synthase-related protein [Candidatus Limnocylindria bacterium]|nr:asparagine synthase-related protein [Candidatus Limnocylindria bacterium]